MPIAFVCTISVIPFTFKSPCTPIAEQYSAPHFHPAQPIRRLRQLILVETGHEGDADASSLLRRALTCLYPCGRISQGKSGY